MMCRHSLMLAAVLVAAGLAIEAEDLADQPRFQLVLHPSTPTTALTKVEVSNLFLEKTTEWNNGDRVMPVDLSRDSGLRANFSEIIHGRKVSAVRSYWQRQIFSGRAVPPPEKETEEEVLDFVRTHPGAIGYVSAEAEVEGVRILELKD